MIKIAFQGQSSNNAILSRLADESSGFMIDMRESNLTHSLKWGTGDTLSLVGVLLSAAQLAVSIYQILQSNTEKISLENSSNKVEFDRESSLVEIQNLLNKIIEDE